MQRPAFRSQTRTVSSRADETMVPKGASKSRAVIMSLWAWNSLIEEPGSKCSCLIGWDFRRAIL